MKAKKVDPQLDMITEGSVWQRTSNGRFVTVIGVTNTTVKDKTKHPSLVVFFDSMGRLYSESLKQFLAKRTFYNVDPSVETKVIDILNGSSENEEQEEQDSIDIFEQLVAPSMEKTKSKDPFGFGQVLKDSDDTVIGDDLVTEAAVQEAEASEDSDEAFDLIVEDEVNNIVESADETIEDIVKEINPVGVVSTTPFDFKFEENELPEPIGVDRLQNMLVEYEQNENMYSGVMYTLHKFTFAVPTEDLQEAVHKAFDTEQKLNKIVHSIASDALGIMVEWDALVEATVGWNNQYGKTYTVVLGVREPLVEEAKVIEVTPDVQPA